MFSKFSFFLIVSKVLILIPVTLFPGSRTLIVSTDLKNNQKLHDNPCIKLFLLILRHLLQTFPPISPEFLVPHLPDYYINAITKSQLSIVEEMHDRNATNIQ